MGKISFQENVSRKEIAIRGAIHQERELTVIVISYAGMIRIRFNGCISAMPRARRPNTFDNDILYVFTTPHGDGAKTLIRL
jgi:hypothetical protein